MAFFGEIQVQARNTATPLQSVAQDVPDAESVRSELARILGSECFVTSSRMRALLEYIVNRTLDGHGERIKEYTIGVEVFGRNEDFDPRIETVVRTEAWRLRARLDRYYQAEGSANPLRIELARRSFAVVARVVAAPVLVAPIAAVSQTSLTRLAVLPFAVVDDRPDLASFADDLADELNHALGRLPRIEMVARWSCRRSLLADMDTRELARRLEADWIIEGSIRRRGLLLRILVQIVDARTGCQVCTHEIERPWNDTLAFTRDVSCDLVAELMRGAGAWRTPFAEAFVESLCCEMDLRQMLLFGMGCPPHIVDALRRAIGWLEERLQRDPSDALSHMRLSKLLALFISIVPAASADLMPRLKHAALAAIQVDRRDASALVALGMAALFVCDWPSANHALAQAVAISPHDCGARIARGLCLMQMGQLDSALGDLHAARERHPLSATVTSTLAAVLLNSRRYPEAAELAYRAVSLDADFRPAAVLLADAMLWHGRTANAVARLEEFSRLDGRTAFSLGKLGFAYGRSGNSRKARELLDELGERHDDPARITMARANIHLGLSEHDAALDALDAAVDTPNAPELLLRSAPQFDPLRKDPRFGRLLARLGLDDSQTVAAIPLPPTVA